MSCRSRSRSYDGKDEHFFSLEDASHEVMSDNDWNTGPSTRADVRHRRRRPSLVGSEAESSLSVSNCAFCKQLLLRGQTVEKCSHQGQFGVTDDGALTPLQHLFNAAAAGDLETIEWLMLSGVDASQRDKYEVSALHVAASHGRMPVVEFLLSERAAINGHDLWGFTALDCALNNGHVHVAEFLQSRGALPSSAAGNDQLGVKLCALAAAGSLEELKAIGTRGADLSTGDYDHRTALHLAAAENRPDIVSYLLSREEIDVNAVDRFGVTPLRDAKTKGHEEICQLLLDAGATLEGVEHSVRAYRLLAACNEGRLKLVEKLVEKENTDVNTPDYDGRTALHLAAASGYTDVVKYLLAHGAVVDPVDRWGRDPYQVAVENGQTKIAELLDEKGQFTLLQHFPLDDVSESCSTERQGDSPCCIRFGRLRDPIASVLDLALNYIGTSQGWAYAELWVVDPPIASLQCCSQASFISPRFEHCSGDLQRFRQSSLHILVEHSLFFSATPIRRNSAVWISDLSTTSQAKLICAPMARRAHLQTCVCCPVQASDGGPVLGYAVFYHEAERKESDFMLSQMKFVFERTVDVLITRHRLATDDISRQDYVAFVHELLQRYGDADSPVEESRRLNSALVPPQLVPESPRQPDFGTRFILALFGRLQITRAFFEWGCSVNSEDHKAALPTLLWLAEHVSKLPDDLVEDIREPLLTVLQFLVTVSPLDARNSHVHAQAQTALESLSALDICKLSRFYFDAEKRSPIFFHLLQFKKSVIDQFETYGKREAITGIAAEKPSAPSLRLTVGEVFEACGSHGMTSPMFGGNRRGFGFFGRPPVANTVDEYDQISQKCTEMMQQSDHHPLVSMENILALHSVFHLEDSVAGELRTMRVVGSHMFYRFYRVFSPPEEVSSLLELFVRDMQGEVQAWNGVQKAFYFYGALVMFIHPFEDGNGRLGRLFANMILKAEGYKPVFNCTHKVVTFEEVLSLVLNANEYTC